VVSDEGGSILSDIPAPEDKKYPSALFEEKLYFLR
jgi:hypothetical protein